MKIMIHEPITQEVEINFSLVSVTDRNASFENPVVALFMQFNDETYNCCVELSALRNKESALTVLQAAINTLVNQCYDKEYIHD